MPNDAIKFLAFEDSRYPRLLKEIPRPPKGIYVRGTMPDFRNTALAIVGTRKAGVAGKELAYRMGEELSSMGLIIVSGLAFGIDAAAHEGALHGQGKTIAVLAHGLHTINPASNARLGERILESGGTLISEYPTGTPAKKGFFAARNRIVSGLAKAVLIIEAPRKSGALLTARFALEQGREVLVSPGGALNPNYAGSHELIRSGATLACSREHVIEALGFNQLFSPLAFSEKNTEDYGFVLDVLTNAEKPLTIDKISELTNLNVESTIKIVTLLILNGKADETPYGILIKHGT
ncbi:MAG: DNA-processing protein DprA [Candidatus Liptonbacteria bacterium]